jgi:hypothetical protein
MQRRRDGCLISTDFGVEPVDAARMLERRA